MRSALTAARNAGNRQQGKRTKGLRNRLLQHALVGAIARGGGAGPRLDRRGRPRCDEEKVPTLAIVSECRRRVAHAIRDGADTPRDDVVDGRAALDAQGCVLSRFASARKKMTLVSPPRLAPFVL